MLALYYITKPQLVTSSNLNLMSKVPDYQVANTSVPEGFGEYNLQKAEKNIASIKEVSFERNIDQSSCRSAKNNQKEFGVASNLSKVLRQSFSGCMSEICESYVSGKLTAKFRNLATMEKGQKGTRPLNLSKHGHLLNGFEFNSKAPYKKIVGAKYFVKNGSRKGQVILHFPAFVPQVVFDCPDEVTNFKVNARLVALSDYSFDKRLGNYRLISEEVHGKFGAYESNMLPLVKIPVEPMTGLLSIPQSQIQDGVGIFLVMAVSFFKYERGRFHHLAESSGMQIHEVY